MLPFVTSQNDIQETSENFPTQLTSQFMDSLYLFSIFFMRIGSDNIFTAESTATSSLRSAITSPFA